LDIWNPAARSWATASPHHQCTAINSQLSVKYWRDGMEWALADGNLANARRWAGCLDKAARRLERRRPEPEVRGFAVQDASFPATLKAMIEDFDRREYAHMMRAFAK
jgi:hypothetical protein